MSTLFGVPQSAFSNFFKNYYNIELSVDFIRCAETQLSSFLLKEIGLEVSSFIFLLWQPEERPLLSPGKISSLSTTLCFKYGKVNTKILWTAKSDHIYTINETEINCDDIKFSFDNLDKDHCYRLMFPKWSLITFREAFKIMFNKDSGQDISLEFINCLDNQLSTQFENITSIKINKEIVLTWLDKRHEAFEYVTSEISTLSLKLSIHNFESFVTAYWKSKSGRIYKLNDTDIDCENLEFGFKHLDIDLYLKQIMSGKTLKLPLKNLSFELLVQKLNIHCTLRMNVKRDANKHGKEIIDELSKFVNDFNEKSEKKQRQNGLVHNSAGLQVSSDVIEFDCDLGSAGISFLKKLLLHMSKMNCFEKVTVE